MAQVKEFMPAIAMVAVQAGYAGLNVLSKLALESGMSPYVLIAYRQIIATFALAPIAFFLERKTCTKITAKILLQIFICSIFGATINQLLYCIGLKYTTSTIASALTNILPALTFIMAVPFRIERADIKSYCGQAKIVGTVLCVGGSMMMTFYKGPLIHIPSSGIHWRYAENMAAKGMEATTATGGSSDKQILGAMLVVGSCAAWAAWFIMQAKMSKSFSAPYTTSTLICAMASLQCLLIGGAVERDWDRWALGFDIRLAASLYIGLIGSGLAVSLMTWAIEKRGPLFVSMFSPLLLVIVAVLGWAILDEKLFLGSALGSVIIVTGLYLVLWGKAREFKVEASEKKAPESEEKCEDNQDIKVELSNNPPNANYEKTFEVV
ncbi:WAT1-related protein At1g09380-like [Phalaenopsis equestris]|uniref:WAT1-related protein At1g09380-like n=1 Tax=Phalaenopsis equestris TaxID=78828 RepID=UPI0009E26B71|nr:WAT1-related protein At1g09380-like [Phalaenopsis equestris]